MIGAGNCEFAVSVCEFFGDVCSQTLVSSRNPIVTRVADANHVRWVDFVIIDLAFEGTRVTCRHHRFKRAWPGVLGAIFTARFLVCVFVFYDILLLRTNAVFDIIVIDGTARTAHAGQSINRGYLLAGANAAIRCAQINLVCVREDAAGWALTS